MVGGTAIARVNQHLANICGGNLIVPAELFQLANSPSTIYNILSKKQKEGEVIRKARGVYVRAGEAEYVSVADIAEKKAARFDKVVKAKEKSEKDESRTDKHEFWTNGRSTSFRVFVDGQPADTVIFTERSRPNGGTRSRSMLPSKPDNRRLLRYSKGLIQSISEYIESKGLGSDRLVPLSPGRPKQVSDLSDSPRFKLSSTSASTEFILHGLFEFCRKLLLDTRSIADTGLRRVTVTVDLLTLVLDFNSSTAISKPP